MPSPSTQVTPARSTPDGIRWVTYFLPSTTSVWPALAPPPQRATTCARSVSRSTTLPFALVAPLGSDDDDDCHGFSLSPRLGALARALAARGLSGGLLPSCDANLGEQPAPRVGRRGQSPLSVAVDHGGTAALAARGLPRRQKPRRAGPRRARPPAASPLVRGWRRVSRRRAAARARRRSPRRRWRSRPRARAAVARQQRIVAAALQDGLGRRRARSPASACRCSSPSRAPRRGRHAGAAGTRCRAELVEHRRRARAARARIPAGARRRQRARPRPAPRAARELGQARGELDHRALGPRALRERLGEARAVALGDALAHPLARASSADRGRRAPRGVRPRWPRSMVTSGKPMAARAAAPSAMISASPRGPGTPAISTPAWMISRCDARADRGGPPCPRRPGGWDPARRGSGWR